MAGKIFVNYRRDDSASEALNVAQYLERAFGKSRIFIDIDRLRAGQKFPEVLEDKLNQCAAMLAIIGPNWVAARDDDTGMRRLDTPADWVRLEIERALARDIPVIPVLVGGAALPRKQDLPDKLKLLIEHQVATVTTNGFRNDMAGLASDLRELLPPRRWPMVVGAAAALLGAAGLAMYLGAIPTPAAVSALKSQFDRMSNDKSERLQRDAEAQRQADEADRRRVALLEEIEQKRRQEAEEAARTAAAAPGQTFRDCNYGCPEMVVVPSGSFTVGSPVSEAGRDSDEGPQHTVTVSRPFAVGKFEVTFDEWQQCVAGGGCQTNRNPGDNGWGKERRPVTKVSWSDAREYVAWLALKTGKPYRLLSEAEWEYAARAGTTTLYAWGDPIGLRNANCSRCGSQWDNKQTAPAGSFAPNAFGLYDMHGNVWEWVEDCWHDDYVGAPSDGSVWTAACADKSRRVLRGGSWNDVPELLRSANRIWYSTGTRNPNNGFRVARSLP